MLTATSTPDLYAAVAELNAGRGGEIRIGPGEFVLKETIHRTQPIMFAGEGEGAATGDSYGSDRAVTTLRWEGSPGQPMIHDRAEAAGEWVFGGGIRGLLLDGNRLASHGVLAEGTKWQDYRMRIWACREAGLELSGGNGGAWSGHCSVWMQYRRGYGDETKPSHGVVLGNQSGLACVQHAIWKLWGQIHDGDLLRIVGNADNNKVYWLHARTEKTGSGYGLRLVNGPEIAKHPRNNVFYYIGATGGTGIYAESETRGNRVLHLTAETCPVTVEAGGQLHYDVLDHLHNDVFAAPRRPLVDTLCLDATAARATGAGASQEVMSNLHPAVLLSQRAAGASRWTRPAPWHWSDGNIVAARISYAQQGAGGLGSVPASLRVTTYEPGEGIGWQRDGAIVGLELAAAPHHWQQVEVPVNCPVSPGNLIHVSLVRAKGGDSRAVGILSVELIYHSSGPDSQYAGSRYDNSPPWRFA